jgi:flagella basal body P-ring formation protein FlgA
MRLGKAGWRTGLRQLAVRATRLGLLAAWIAGLSVAGAKEAIGGAQGDWSALASLIRSKIAAQLPDSEKVAVEVIRVTGSLPGQLDQASIRVRVIGWLRPGLANSFELSGVGPGGKWMATVVARVQVASTVLVAARDLSPGQLLGAEDVTLEERDLAGLLGEPLTRPEEAVGKRVRGSVRSGKVLTKAMLAEPQAMRRGEVVRLVASVGGVQVETQGRTLQSGAVGEEILVRNVRSGKTVKGVVVSADEVWVRAQ